MNSKANLIVQACSRLSREPKPICKTQAEYKAGQVFSLLPTINNTQITTRLIPVSMLTAEERKNIFEIFKENFASTVSKEKINQEFREEFTPDRLIDLIYYKKIIGFVLAEIVIPDPIHFRQHLFVYGNYVAIKRDFRDTGLMQILLFRLAYTLKELNKNMTVGYIFSAIHKNSYRLVDQLVHWPKYQDDDSTAIAQHLITSTMPECRFVHQDLVAFVEEKIVVKADPNPKPVLFEAMYNEEILGKGEGDIASGHIRAVPVVFAINAATIAFMVNYSRCLGIDFISLISGYANALSGFIKEHEKTPLRLLSSSCHGFFKSENNFVELGKCVPILKQKL